MQEKPKNFTMIDEEFTCAVCGKKVMPLNYSARDHCPYCLSSMHLDINPGDRLCDCKGILKPIDIEKFKDTYKIIYKCEKCGYLHKNKVAIDDDFDKILEIMQDK
ncbi:MAG: RNHCP domain-containing protein [Bacilli bacterium]|nr:RNHCP domain-containing protein [Bacilli bacterium]